MLKGLCVGLLAGASAALTGTFWQITDTHWEPGYITGADVPEKFCREKLDGSKDTAKQFGDHRCDTPTATIRSAFEELAKVGGDPDFIMWNGDHVSNFDPNLNETSVTNYLSDAAKYLYELHAAFPKAKIYPTLGNHDTHPPYQFPEKGPWFIYDHVANIWQDLIGAENAATVKENCIYTDLIAPGLRLLAIHTAGFFGGNGMLKPFIEDPGNQFAWIRSVLQKAREAGEKVIVMGHIPPGYREIDKKDRIYDWYNSRFMEAFSGYHEDVIVAGFYGHYHTLGFHLFPDVKRVDNETFTEDLDHASIAFIAGSAATRPGVNPSVNVFKYDTTNPYTILSQKVYYTDLNADNDRGTIEWDILVDTEKDYGLKDMSTKSMREFMQRLKDDHDLFVKFRDNATLKKVTDFFGDCKTKECLAKMMCCMEHSILSIAKQCVESIQ